MCSSATSSSTRAALAAAALLLLPPLAAAGGGTGQKLSRDEALALAFPGATVRRSTVYLTRAQRRRAEKLAHSPLASGIARPYKAFKDGKLVGTAWFDTHKVRTLKETLMIVVDPAGRVRRMEILAFGEPADYIPPAAWYAQFPGRALDDDLDLKRGIRGVTGATLTARATTAAVRRALALDRVLRDAAAAPAP